MRFSGYALMMLSFALASLLLARVVPAEEEHVGYTETPLSEAERDFWSFQPIKQVSVPETKFPEWSRNEIDAFIGKRLEEKQLTPQRPAPRQTLIRRLSFDLTGMPPEPEEIEAFVNDSRDDAYERLVERLLTSPRYGERWVQHWLDLARFAETDGFEHDKVRPNAWKYRDWVIEALNKDLPYDEFIRLQIAGDELHPDDEEARTATRFCLSGPDMPDINLLSERRHNLLNEMTATVGEVVLGLQIGCAQCHDHKFDPISQADFYRMRAAFAPAVQLKKNQSVSVMKEKVPYEQSSHVMTKGSFDRPGPEVQPGLIRVATSPGEKLEPEGKEHSAGLRTALAEWLVSPENPLTARVIVNRVWQHHFGEGIVGTPSDFGIMGDWPSHPELLDWLAIYLREHDWSLKELHRLIVTSATYRQRSYLPATATEREQRAWEAALKADPENELLSRYGRWRLEGEAIRDAMLLASGRLNLKMGGPGVRPPLSEELKETLLKNQWNVTEDKDEYTRRSIYIFARRNLRYPIFQVFDRPIANSSCPERYVSTTAPQSLHLLNSEFSWKCAREMAAMLEADCPTREAKIRTAFQRTLGREPTEQELGDVQQFWTKQSALAAEDSSPLAHLCLSLYNCNEFLIVD